METSGNFTMEVFQKEYPKPNTNGLRDLQEMTGRKQKIIVETYCSDMNTTGFENQIATGNEKTAEAFNNKTLFGYVQTVLYRHAGKALEPTCLCCWQ